MKKLLLLFAVMLSTVGVWAQTSVTYEDGLYKIYWQADQRGYLTYHETDYPDDPQLAGVVNHNPNGHYQLTDEGIKLGWYLYTSKKTGKSYLFEATTGKFIKINLSVNVGNGKQCKLSTDVSVANQFNLLASDGDVAGSYLLRFTDDKNYHFCSGCGSNKGNDPVRFSSDGQGDGGNRFVFVEDVDLTISEDVKNAAITKIEAFEDEPLVDVTTNLSSPIYYTIKNVRTGKYATYMGSSSTMSQRADATSAALFYFTTGTEDGTVKIHNYFSGDNKCASYNSWTVGGIDWYLLRKTTGLAISNDKDGSGQNTSWNDAGGNGQLVQFWTAPDAGSSWILEKFTGDVDDLRLTLSNSDVKTLYNIQNRRSTKYVDYVGSGKQFKQESEIKYGSYWYFVDAKSELPQGTEIPANTQVCRIYNAANTLAVENPSNGNMSKNEGVQYPAKIYFLRPFEHSGRFGYTIYPYNETDAGWNDYNNEKVCNFNFNDAGSIWAIMPANKTTDQLIQEATTAKNDALALFADAEEADYYTYSGDAIATAKTAVEGIDVSTLENSVSSLVESIVVSALNTLKETEQGSTAPGVGQYIQLKNRKYKTYLQDNGTDLNGVNDATGNSTLWLVVAGDEGKVKLQNVATNKYIGQIRDSQGVAMVEEANAKQFEFTNETEIYGVFHETTGANRAYGHINSSNKLVGWEKGAEASQWIISEVSVEEALDELQAIYNIVDNAFGDQPGQYKQSMQEVDETMYTNVEGVVKFMLEDGAVVDVPTARNVIISLKAQWDGVKTTVREINAPAQGKFYRLKNAFSGNYMCGNANDVKLLADGTSVHTTIFYLGENNTLLSYNSGRYLDCSAKGYSEVGVAITGEFAMAYGGAQANVITYKNNGYSTYGAGADGAGLDRGKNSPDHIGYNWKLEEVTWLPIPVNVEAGYTTIYSPVELELSQGRFKAYTVSKVSETYATLAEQTVVPAGVGVVLEYQDGAQIDNGCVYLRIKANETVGVTSELLGTYADEYISADAYVLSMVDGEVGFYKATKNQQEKTAFLNNGFKAYLPATTGVESRFLVFNFGDDNATAIESIEAENAADAVVYDLAGRRVQNAQKGVFIVNGKVVIK